MKISKIVNVKRTIEEIVENLGRNPDLNLTESQVSELKSRAEYLAMSYLKRKPHTKKRERYIAAGAVDLASICLVNETNWRFPDITLKAISHAYGPNRLHQFSITRSRRDIADTLKEETRTYL